MSRKVKNNTINNSDKLTTSETLVPENDNNTETTTIDQLVNNEVINNDVSEMSNIIINDLKVEPSDTNVTSINDETIFHEKLANNKPSLFVKFTNISARTIYTGTYYILSGRSKTIPRSVAKALIENDSLTKYNINRNFLITDY